MKKPAGRRIEFIYIVPESFAEIARTVEDAVSLSERVAVERQTADAAHETVRVKIRLVRIDTDTIVLRRLENHTTTIRTDASIDWRLDNGLSASNQHCPRSINRRRTTHQVKLKFVMIVLLFDFKIIFYFQII